MKMPTVEAAKALILAKYQLEICGNTNYKGVDPLVPIEFATLADQWPSIFAIAVASITSEEIAAIVP